MQEHNFVPSPFFSKMGRAAKKRKILPSSHEGTCPRDLLQRVVLGTIPLVCADLYCRVHLMLNCIMKLKKAPLRNHGNWVSAIEPLSFCFIVYYVVIYLLLFIF